MTKNEKKICGLSEGAYCAGCIIIRISDKIKTIKKRLDDIDEAHFNLLSTWEDEEVYKCWCQFRKARNEIKKLLEI